MNDDIKNIDNLNDDIDNQEENLDDNDNNDLNEKIYQGNVKDINISKEMKTSFLSYAMSVIVSRALPDARDGLKPVQRRILYAMNDLKIVSGSAYKKSARIVGEVIGKYHPHGDTSVYEAMVRMAQDFNFREPLIDGHGNFGSVDGDGAAAMRYTEARMSKIAMEMIRDIDKNTVDFQDNYDQTEKEPTILPARIPNLLVNGAQGIAVGMATSIPTHNLGEVIDGLLAYMANRDLTVLELMQYIKGPDFPTGGQVLGLTDLIKAYETGHGKVVMRAETEIVNFKNKQAIIVKEIPYGVNKTNLIEKIASLVKGGKDQDKVLDGITDLRDESNLKGMRIVIELRKDINPHVMLNNLYKYTQLQQTFSINMIALVNNEPKRLSLKDTLQIYLDHQIEILVRRTKYLLEKALARQHILEALVIALNDIDRCIQLIKESKNTQEAQEKLIKEYQFTEIQAKAILDMKLNKLTSLEIDKIKEEHKELAKQIEEYKFILEDDNHKLELIAADLKEMKSKYAKPRKSQINLHEDINLENEDLIPVEDMVVTITKNGYIKRMKQDEYRLQNRGGVGMTGIKMHEDDYVEYMANTTSHDYHLFFTNLGRVYKIKGYTIPQGSRTSKGLPIVNLINFLDGEKLTNFTTVKDFDREDMYFIFVTKKGMIKRTQITEYKNIRQNGINAINLKENDELISVFVSDGNSNILLTATNGKAIRFKESDIRPTGRVSQGVIGMNIDSSDEIVSGLKIEDKEQEVLVITKNGYGKRTDINEYRLQKRGGKGIKTINITKKNGPLCVAKIVYGTEDLIVSTDMGIVIRVNVSQISQIGRNTQGVKVINLKDNQSVATTTLVEKSEDEEIENIDKPIDIEQETLDLNGNTQEKEGE